jgi:transient receptor potential cation channel subfamily M protein 3
LLQALISHEKYGVKNTVVQENGKVVAECDDINQHFHFPLDYFEVKNSRPLRLRKKLYEFYTAPITKFWGHSVSDWSSANYFLLNLSYMLKP